LVIRLILLLVTAMALLGQTNDSLVQAYDALRAMDYDRAIQSFRQSIAAAPDRASVRKDLAYTLLKVGDAEAARDQFAEAVRLDPNDEQAALEYAFLCYETRQPATARRVFDRIRKNGNTTAAQAFENIDPPLREGIAQWTRVLALSPDNLSAHEELARLAEQRDEFPLAAEHYEKAWRLRPERRALLLDLGRVLKASNRDEDANAALLAASRSKEPRVAEQAKELLPQRYPYVYEFQKALELDPSNLELRRELAYLYLEMGNRTGAQQEFQHIVDHAPDDRIAVTQLRFLRQKPREMGEQSFEKGYLKDALRYFQSAHEDDPLDFNVILKLGWTYNMLKDDQEAVRWFNLARRSPDSKIAAEASRAYHNLEPALRRFRTTVWISPMFSTRWHDVFAYAQLKTELRLGRSFVRPYVSLRLIGDSRGAVELAGTMGPQYLSERTMILGVGLATAPWYGVTGWFEAGESLRYQPDYRGGLAYAKGFGHLLVPGQRGLFTETSDDAVFVSRFSHDTLLYSQNRAGFTLPGLQLYWNLNATVDVLGQYWANYAETGPGLRFRFAGLPPSLYFSVNAMRGAYLINQGNPRRPNFTDIRVGMWYALSH
jgi:tetratricopeptide (TPR) repeat protein